MSSSNRTTSHKGGKGAKADSKAHKSDKSDTGKGSEKQQANRDTHSKAEDPGMKAKVQQLMDLSERSEEEVCSALHENDYDVNMAMNTLLENTGHGEWETTVKKKKNRQPSASKDKADELATGDEWNDAPQPSGGNAGGGTNGDKDKSRNKSGGPPRLHGRHNDSRGWRGREKQENERNLEEGGGRGGDFQRERRGRPGGSTRGAGGARGRGGGRAGGRYPPRGNRSNSYNKPIETWDNSNTWDNNTVAAPNNHTENWDDFPGPDEWTTEEYTGSLADTKVFTPSVQSPLEAADSPPAGAPIDNAAVNQQLNQPPLQAPQLPSQSPVQLSGATLTAAQTQYLNQLTQQNSDNIKQYGTAQTYHAQTSNQAYSSAAAANVGPQSYANNQQYGTSPGAYVNNAYSGANNNYVAEAQPTQQPARTRTQRARVPPPSKIPDSAVEMPGDLNSSIGFLDVQFGVMDFMSDGNSFDGVSDNKYSNNSTGLDNSSGPVSDLNAANQSATLDAYSPKSNTQGSISSALSQSLNNSESIPQTSEHLSNAYTAPRSAATGGAAAPSVTPSALELSKQGDGHSYSQASTYNSYQPKSNTYNTTYSGTQTSNSYVSNQANSNYANSQAASYNTASGNAYQNTYSSAASYQTNSNASGFPSISQANSYPSNNQTYQQSSSQSVYGANSGLNNSSNFGNTTSQYNNYSSASNHKLGKDSAYDSNSVSNAQTTTSSNASTTALTTVATKSSTALAPKNSSNVVSNLPPGVTPVMSTPYIMGQVPYFQPPVYSYEDMQILQQRMPHMTTPYYDMSYQTPTTLAAVRDGTLGSVGYSISDGRFARGDNNASPVPSTLSQQTSTLTQGHQAQPILAGGAHPYFFTAALNTFPNYQFGTMYTQLPAATNAHGSSNSTQYPKQATYGSSYGGYDSLSQTQDYNKTGYVGNSQGQKGGGVNATCSGSSGNDLSTMYGKSHGALAKGNSYDKQGFHSGTPPGVLHGALHGGQSAGLAPSATGYAPQVYIPTMTPHQQQLSTQLMHQPLHQDSGNNGGQRSQSSNAAKGGAKQAYQTSYWNPA